MPRNKIRRQKRIVRKRKAAVASTERLGSRPSRSGDEGASTTRLGQQQSNGSLNGIARNGAQSMSLPNSLLPFIGGQMPTNQRGYNELKNKNEIAAPFPNSELGCFANAALGRYVSLIIFSDGQK